MKSLSSLIYRYYNYLISLFVNGSNELKSFDFLKGSGVYFAENSSKSDDYIKTENKDGTGIGFIILSRVVLGIAIEINL